MNTTESEYRTSDTTETITTRIYTDGKLVKTIVVRNDFVNDYVQTHIYDEWGYKTMWYDNHGKHQKFGRVVKTEGKPSEIGKMDGDSWYITDTDRNLFKGKFYTTKDFERMRLRYFCEPLPNHIKEW